MRGLRDQGTKEFSDLDIWVLGFIDLGTQGLMNLGY